MNEWPVWTGGFSAGNVQKVGDNYLADRRQGPILSPMIELRLAPSQNEAEFGNESLVGEWASYLPEALSKPQRPPWCSYAVSLNNRIVGLGGFKGEPEGKGPIELSYMTFQPERERGIATAICSELISIARAAKVSKLIAHTLPEENASTAVLKANKFFFVGAVNDPDDGCVWEWCLNFDA